MKKTKEVRKHLTALEDAKEFFGRLYEEKQEEFDSKSEKWQESDKGEEARDFLDSLEQHNQDLENTSDNYNDLFGED